MSENEAVRGFGRKHRNPSPLRNRGWRAYLVLNGESEGETPGAIGKEFRKLSKLLADSGIEYRILVVEGRTASIWRSDEAPGSFTFAAPRGPTTGQRGVSCK